MSEDEDRISWHPAFFEAIQLELEEYGKYLEFISEYQLTKEPLRIDVVIIKKTKDIVIKKNIASIFRKDNIVEYKSPDDHVSIDDYYQVYAYACLYKTINRKDIREITLTFVGSRKPRELLGHLERVRGYGVEEKWPGIYIISGDVMPMQIIDSRKLSGKDDKWLRDLSNRLGKQEMSRITREAIERGKDTRADAYYDAIMRANYNNIPGVNKMADYISNMALIARASGLAKIWEDAAEARGIAVGETKGEEKKATEIAMNLLRKGFSIDQAAELSGLEVEKIMAFGA